MGPSISDLPEPIIWDILSRLPLRAIFAVKCVCKTWLSTILNPHFNDLLMAKSCNCLLIYNYCLDNFKVFDIEKAVESVLFNSLEYEINPKLSKVSMGIKSSNKLVCRGLVCLYVPLSWSPYYLYNPITGESIGIPQVEIANCENMNSGFGYCTRTKKYKLMRILKYQPELFDSEFVVEILTLGTSSWRRIGFAPTYFCIPGIKGKGFHVYGGSPFYLEGSIHWSMFDDTSHSLCSFDFEDERFNFIPLSPHMGSIDPHKYGQFSVGPLRGSLCCCDQTSDDHSDVWVMKNYGIKESWTKELTIYTGHENPTYFPSWYVPIHFLDNGPVLFLFRTNALKLYDPSEKTFRMELYYGSLGDWMICFMPNFVSLQDVVMGRI